MTFSLENVFCAWTIGAAMGLWIGIRVTKSAYKELTQKQMNEYRWRRYK